MNSKYIDMSLVEPLRAIEKQSGKPIISTLVTIYVSETPALIEKMKKALCDKDFEVLGRSAHSLKSSSAYLGAKDVRDICKVIEDLSLHVEDKNIDLLQSHFSNLITVAMGTVEEIKTVFSN